MSQALTIYSTTWCGSEDTPPEPHVGFDTGVPAAPPDRPGLDGGTGRAPQYAQRP